jgi:hypothetical protein
MIAEYTAIAMPLILGLMGIAVGRWELARLRQRKNGGNQAGLVGAYGMVLTASGAVAENYRIREIDQAELTKARDEADRLARAAAALIEQSLNDAPDRRGTSGAKAGSFGGDTEGPADPVDK